MENCPKCRTRVRKSSGDVCPVCGGLIEQPVEVVAKPAPKTSKK